MKKTLFLFLIFLSFVSFAQEWDYPVKPGMEKWQQFGSMADMYQACQIPDSVLKQIDTESLVEICLNFPAPPLFLFFNSPQQAFMQYYSNFNGIRELFERKDAGKYLLKKYSLKSFSDFDQLWQLHQQGRFVAHYKFTESILSQPQIIATLDADGRKALLKESILKMDEKVSKTDLFGGNSLTINMWVIGNLLYNEDKTILREYDPQRLQTALKMGVFVDIDIDMLFQQAKKYVYENE